jgi:hypothetical protein
VPRNGLYVIQGEKIRTTSQFLLPDDRSDVTLTVQAGSAMRMGGGAALLLAGGILGYLGLLAAELGLAVSSLAPGGGNSDSAAVTAAGLGALAVGMGAVIGGVYLILTSRTNVTSSTGSTFTNRDRPRARSAVALTPNGFAF